MLPLSLKDGEGIDAAGLSRPLEVPSLDGVEVEFWVQLDFKKTKRTTIEKNIYKLAVPVSVIALYALLCSCFCICDS
jgi:hypothetical protein